MFHHHQQQHPHHQNHIHLPQQHNPKYPTLEMQQAHPIQVSNHVEMVPQQNAHMLQQGSQQFGQFNNQGYPMMVQQPPMYYYPLLKSFKEIIGDFKIPMMINFCSYLAAFAILITYIVACSLGHQQWFPCMITSAGTDYPENIFFRIGLLTTIFYWIIMIVFEYWWLRAHCESLMGVVSVSNKMNIVAFVGFFFYGLTIATIDDGHIPTQFHGACAVFFFILLCIYTQWSFQTIRAIRKLKPNFMSNSSYDRKKFFAFAWIAVFFFLILLALKFKWGLAVAEWIGTYSIIFYLQTFATDLKNFYLNVDDQQFDEVDFKVQISRNHEELKQHNQQNLTQNYPIVQNFPTVQIQNQPIQPVIIPQFKQPVHDMNNLVNHRNVHQENTQHSQSFFQARNEKQQFQNVSQSHFQPNPINCVNSQESNSTIDNSFMSIKKPFFAQGQN